MPKRDNNGDGSWRAMRYEDLLFLQEAYQERYSACRGEILSASPKTRALDALVFKNAANVAKSYIFGQAQGFDPQRNPDYGEFIENSKSSSFNFVETNATKIREALYGLGYNITEEQTGVSGKKLDADDVRYAFWFTKKLVKTLRIVPIGSLYSATVTITAVDSEGHSSSNDPYVDPNFDGMLYWTEYATRVGSSNYRCTFSFKSAPQPVFTPGGYSGSSCNWLYLLQARNKYKGSSWDARRFLVSRNSGPRTYGAGNLTLLTSSLASASGLTYNPSPYYSENESVDFSVLEIAELTTHAFPAEIDSLNWNWQPKRKETK